MTHAHQIIFDKKNLSLVFLFCHKHYSISVSYVLKIITARYLKKLREKAGVGILSMITDFYHSSH